MPTVNEVYAYLQTLAPLELAESWDNPGLLVHCQGQVTGILCALDITAEVVREAQHSGCNVIVSHHPVIFGGVKQLCSTDVVFMLAQSGISTICMHTNLDAAEGGVNDVLAGVFQLQKVEKFGIGRVGMLPGNAPVSPLALAQLCRDKLGASVRLASVGKPVHRVAVMGGSGADYLNEAAKAGADAYITGDAGHHAALDALALGVSLLAAGHYETEFPVIPVLARQLQSAFPAVQVTVTQNGASPFVTI